MRRRSVSSWEALARNNEGGGVRSEVEEELSEYVKCKQSTVAEVIEGEANYDEEDSEDDETHQLDGLSANGVNQGDSNPVTRNRAGANQDQVTNRGISENMVDIAATSITDGGKNGGVVKTETVECDVKEEPGTSSAEENLAMPPLRVVSPEIGP